MYGTSQLGAWVDNFFYKGLDIVLKMDMMVDTTMVGTVLNGLSHIAGVKSKGEYIIALIRGLGANLSLEDRCTHSHCSFSSLITASLL